jgi:death-on-curing protein
LADTEPEPSLAAILNLIDVSLTEPIDFLATDTDTTLAKVRLLSAAATYFNTLAVGEYGGRLGPIREQGLVDQVVGAAFQTFGGEDPHPDAYEKAAMLLRGITQGHPFNDGNKRTGFLTAAYYLDLVGIHLPDPLDIDAAERLCLRVSAGDLRDVDAIAAELRRLWQRHEDGEAG